MVLPAIVSTWAACSRDRSHRCGAVRDNPPGPSKAGVRQSRTVNTEGERSGRQRGIEVDHVTVFRRQRLALLSKTPATRCTAAEGPVMSPERNDNFSIV